MEQINDDHDQHHHPFSPSHQHPAVSSSSSSSISCHIFFNSTQDQTDHNYANYNRGAGSSYEIKNNSGLKLTVWKKDQLDHQGRPAESILEKDNNHPNWMPSKMRSLMMNKRTINCSAPKEDHDQNNLQPSTNNNHFETDHFSISNSTTSSYYSSNSPIRVCSDCHTTKTPLWRSGPKGPKSLCNACGIRQRKARRAMAAAAAAANGSTAAVAADQPPARMKIKVLHSKEKKGKNGKRCSKMATDATGGGSAVSRGQKNNKQNLEDFLINLSNNLALHRMFPEDEKDAAILLMALSSGLVHG